MSLLFPLLKILDIVWPLNSETITFWNNFPFIPMKRLSVLSIVHSLPCTFPFITRKKWAKLPDRNSCQFVFSSEWSDQIWFCKYWILVKSTYLPFPAGCKLFELLHIYSRRFSAESLLTVLWLKCHE